MTPKELHTLKADDIASEDLIAESTLNIKPNRMMFLVQRPVYGSRDAPLRWRLELSQSFRQGGYQQLRSDVCVFVRHRKRKEGESNIPNRPSEILIGFIMVRVDDIIFVGNEEEYTRFWGIVEEYKHGEVTRLSEKRSLSIVEFG